MAFTYSVSIPMPSFEDDTLKQMAQFNIHNNGVISVFWNRDTKQIILNKNDEWWIQDDGYIVDALGEILGVKGSIIQAGNMSMWNIHDRDGSFEAFDNIMTNHFYDCKWSDYSCDYLVLQGDIWYPFYD